MASMVQRGNTPSTQMARQYWSQHNWDNLERLRMLDPYAEARNIPGERLEASIPIKGTPVVAVNGPCPKKMLFIMREGSLQQAAAELETYKTSGGNINDRMYEDHLCPGVKELDTFLHVAFRHRKSDVARYLMAQGADASIQNWMLETPRMVAEQTGLDYVIEQMGQTGTDTKWGGATLQNFQTKVMVAPQRSIVETHYAWRDGAPRTTASTKAVFEYHVGSSAMSTRKPVPAPLPHQRENGPSAAVSGRPNRRPHHQSMSSPASHISSTKDLTGHHYQPRGFRVPGPVGSNTNPSVAGSRTAGARLTSSQQVYNTCGTAN